MKYHALRIGQIERIWRINTWAGHSKFPNNCLEGIIGELSDFRRTLRGENIIAFDRNMDHPA